MIGRKLKSIEGVHPLRYFCKPTGEVKIMEHKDEFGIIKEFEAKFDKKLKKWVITNEYKV